MTNRDPQEPYIPQDPPGGGDDPNKYGSRDPQEPVIPQEPPNPGGNKYEDRRKRRRARRREKRRETRDEVTALMPWLTGPLLNLYTRAYIEHGSADLAWADVRQTDEYEELFGGNRREDGSVRWSEMQYMQILEGFQDEVRAIGINPDTFAAEYADLFRNNKSPDEFGAQVNAIFERVVMGGDAILEAYAREFNFGDITREGLIAALISDNVHNAILDEQITIAEITGEATSAGFNPGDLARQLEDIDFNRAQAREFFGEANTMIPAISVLARRHADPDDDFDLEEFAGAAVFNDPEQASRMRRLIKQEARSFQQSGQLGVKIDQAGRLTGLQTR